MSGCCWGRRRSGWAVAASRRWPGRPGCTRTRWRGGVREAEGRPEPRVRAPGGGRKRLTETDPGLGPALMALVEPESRGDPESPLRWTCLSTRNLAGARVPGRRGAGRVGGRQEEGEGRRVRRRRRRVAAPGRPGAGQRARLPVRRDRQGDPVWHLRPGRERRV